LMPWQQLVADVGLEMEDGRMCYREVILSVPRQSGKTVLLFAIEVDRGLMWAEPQRVIYTAQTGADARKKILEDQFPIIEHSPLFGMVKHMHRAAGSESVLFKTGSRVGVAASSAESGHGFTVDLGVLDECWNDQDDRREQAMLPAMSTRPNAQLLLASTMGTDASIYLNRKVEAGRHAAVLDKGSGIAYFEWSIPVDAEIDNPDVWWEYMPALGWTISEGAVAHAFQTMEEAEFRRAYGNQPTKGKHDQVIPMAFWEAVCVSGAEVDRSSPVVFGLDVLPDRTAGAIVASDGEIVELVDHRSGVGWMVERCQELAQSWNGEFAVDGGGPAASIASDLEAVGLTVYRMANPDVIAGCAAMYDAIADHRVTVRTSPALDEAIAGLAKRPVGDRFVWSRSTSLSDITPFMAGTLAYARALRQESEINFIAF
jgi:hypothetical protein